jgi:hypothetical protein
MSSTTIPFEAAIVLPTVAPLGVAVDGRSVPCAD